MRETVIVFPFDAFGSAGTGAGAQLLGDAVREILDDSDEETRPCRGHSLRGNVDVREFSFETPTQLRDWRKIGRAAARRAFRAGDFLLWLSGNHLGALPVLEELGRETLVVQFDAHLDVYRFHDTTKSLSHGNFLRHFEAPRPRLVNVGHRDLFLTEKEIAETFETTYSAVTVATEPDRVAAELRAAALSAKRVWLDVDADAFDPSVLPAVRQPLPFGLLPPTFLRLLDAAWGGNVVGMSISEFDPGCDVRDASLQLLGWFVEYVLLRSRENEPRQRE
jgi:arginase family enzyme